MKRLAFTLALLLSTMVAFSQNKDADKHTLVSLWKTYYKAEQADRPQDQLKALEAIKEEAVHKRLAWDFYDASNRYVSVRSSINWKDRDEALKAQDREVDAFPEPVVTFFHYYHSWKSQRLAAFVEENKSKLQNASNPEFYREDYRINSSRFFGPALQKLIKNDYEYALWSLCLGGIKSPINDYYTGRYPEEAFLEFKALDSMNDKDADSKYKQFAKKYNGKAVALMARQRLLEMEFHQLGKDNKGRSEDYKRLREKCRVYESDRSKFTGMEKVVADCCTEVKSIAEILDSKDIRTHIKDDKLTITVRNIRSLNLHVLNGSKVVYQATLTNRRGSYYIQDTIQAALPTLDDAEYTVICKSGDCEDQSEWSKHSLSVSMRQDAQGYRVYVADYMSGKPLESCDLELLDADERHIAKVENVALDGFTPLPEKLAAKIPNNGVFYVRAVLKESGRLLDSRRAFNFSSESRRSDSGSSVIRGIILADRKAFNPGETVQFKAICYTGTYEYQPLPAGEKVELALFDPENKELNRVTLITNEFGSVSGSFPLGGGSRGGRYTLRLSKNGRSLSSIQLRVDEFVLPTFDLKWDEDNRLYLPGDEVKVCGQVKAYSGHSVGKAVARYRVNMGSGADEMGELTLGSDGRFCISFKAQEMYYARSYPVSVTVTDGTGETLEFSTAKYVNVKVPLSLSILNDVDGRYTLSGHERHGNSGWIVRDDTADVRFSAGGLERESLKINYKVISDVSGKQVAHGKLTKGEVVKIPIEKLTSGLYRLEARATATKADGATVETLTIGTFVKASDEDTSLDMDVSCFFKELGGEDIALQIGSTEGPVWAVAELFGSGNEHLGQQIVTLSGKRGKPGSLRTISFKRQADWPESLSMNVLWFKNGSSYSYTRSILLPVPSIKLPLEFTRFTDTTRPGKECSIIIKTLPGVECAATVFDKATETIASNYWPVVSLSRRPEPHVGYTNVCGVNETRYSMVYETSGGLRGNSVAPFAKVESSAMVEDRVAPESDSAVAEESANIPAVREDFAATIAWEPHLRSDANGEIELKFKGGDRLSTYLVQLFAHGEGMQNSRIRREMQVSIPVKLSLVEPLFLYEGDLYTARATVASNLKHKVPGRMAIRFYDGADWRSARVLATRSVRIDLESEGSGSLDAPFKVPAAIKEIGVLVNFVPDDGDEASDALFVTIPVKEAVQTLTEAHSALLRDPAGREELIARLRSEFVNIDASGLEPEDRSIINLIGEAVPQMVEPKGKDALSLTEAWYANHLARRLGAPGLEDAAMNDLADKIAACQNQNGGIAWFDGLEASAVITAAVLQRVAALQNTSSHLPIDIEAAVKYLDNSYFASTGRPWWWGGIDMEKYLHTRALYPSVPFEVKNGMELKEFKKKVRNYLVPEAKRGLNAQILAKARRLRTLQLLSQSDDGVKLAKSWGISIKKRLLRSMDADIESLLQYAVEHKSGGYYYPNAVMPWRGLMESELYAHALLCDLLTDCTGDSSVPLRSGQNGKKGRTVAEGLRLWMMVQKETQKWYDDAAYLEAIASVLRGAPETLEAKVVLLSGSFTKPFPDVRQAGNGFTVSCQWSVNEKPLEPGDVLKLGDKVKATYSIWNEENRSFVRITAPRPASFRPVNQLSGRFGWWLSPLSCGSWQYSPQGYRNVLKDKTEYWFDSYPEENTAITEEFFVAQEGEFQTPAIEVESLYAPHYRANGEGRGHLVSSSPK